MKNATEIREIKEKAKAAYDTQYKVLTRNWLEEKVAEEIEKAALNFNDSVYIPIPCEFRDYYDFMVSYLKQFGYKVQRSKNDLIVFWTI